MDEQTKEQRRTLIANTVIAEAGGYYKLVVGTASLFLGGTLTFWEKIAPAPTPTSLALLGIGWLLLIFCLGLVVLVRLANIEAGRLALLEDWEACGNVGKRNRPWTMLCGLFLAMGMGLVAMSGFVALWSKTMENENKKVKETQIDTRSIPFKEIGTGGSQQGGTKKEDSGNK